MKLLLDSHVLLWSIIKSEALSKNIIREIKDTENQVLVSAVSLWEIALKYGLGKLVFGSFDIRDIPRYCEQMGFELIPLLPQEALGFFKLPRKKQHKGKELNFGAGHSRVPPLGLPPPRGSAPLPGISGPAP